jgi:rod shape-determining protein MreD
MHRRLLWFSVPSQALQVLPVFVAAHGVSLIVRMLAGGMFPGWELGLAPVFEALLWPVVSVALLAPQRRAPDPDKNRPL